MCLYFLYLRSILFICRGHGVVYYAKAIEKYTTPRVGSAIDSFKMWIAGVRLKMNLPRPEIDSGVYLCCMEINKDGCLMCQQCGGNREMDKEIHLHEVIQNKVAMVMMKLWLTLS